MVLRAAQPRCTPSLRSRLLVACAAPFALPRESTLGGALQAATAAFQARDVPEASLSAEHLLTRAAGFGSSRAALASQLNSPLDEDARAAFSEMCAKRLERVPVQYILGDWDFHALTLAVRPPVLIPRPETEELVELVLDAHGAGGAERAASFLDVGCGSGAIGLALLRALPAARCVGVDVSAAAVDLARENAAALGLNARYEAVRRGVAEHAAESTARVDVVVSNPPYIPAADMPGLEPEVRAHEDEGALCGGADGLDVIHQLLTAAPSLLRADGPRAVWLEVDASHPPLIDAWLRAPAQAPLEMRLARWERDAGGHPRFCELRWR